MADRHQRLLERRAAEGDLDAAGRLLAARVRSGGLPAARLDALAALGDPAASRAAGRLVSWSSHGEDAELREVRRRIAAASVWCGEPEAAPERLRDVELGPGKLGWADPLPARVEAVRDLSERRHRALTAGGWVPHAEAHGLAGGRLLLFDPDASLADGAAAAASGGFFDDGNTPPPATWVTYVHDGLPPGFWRNFRSYVVCCVPRRWREAAEQGVAANPEGCLTWADAHTGPFTDRLRTAGLVPG